MEWSFADQPHPEISGVWTDNIWPPERWYQMPELAYGNTLSLWEWDNLPASKTLVTKMTEEQLLLWAVDNIVGQICNGGFDLALDNSYGELAEDAIIGLRKFGLVRHAEIVDEAWNVFGVRPVPRSRIVRWEQLERLSNAEPLAPIEPPILRRAGTIFTEISKAWYDLETEFYGLLNEKKTKEFGGVYTAFYHPIAEWIYTHRDRFFIV